MQHWIIHTPWHEYKLDNFALSLLVYIKFTLFGLQKAEDNIIKIGPIPPTTLLDGYLHCQDSCSKYIIYDLVIQGPGGQKRQGASKLIRCKHTHKT